MKLVTISKEKYSDYRLSIMFDSYKWDPQFVDNNTISRHALVVTENEASEIASFTNKLSIETIAAEKLINDNLQLIAPLRLPKRIIELLSSMSNYDSNTHVRLMRFDFHPVVGGGYALSEVNSDVPGGFAESSIMPAIAENYITSENYYHIDFGKNLVNAIQAKAAPNGTIALVHCTSFSDDRQVMQFLGDSLEKVGFRAIYLAADHLKFVNNKAISMLGENQVNVDFIFRFTPIEWLKYLETDYWRGYFSTVTPSCNHPIALYTQTKRIALAFDDLEKLGADLSTWRLLLPETRSVKAVKGETGYIFKPTLGRIGESISIKSACTKEEYKQILRDVKLHKNHYIAQKMFNSQALTTETGENIHVCIGAYSVEGMFAGFYARGSTTQRIDSNAIDMPVLIERTNK